jgi:hypothetical protein
MIATVNGKQHSDKILTDGWSSDVPTVVRFLYAGTFNVNRVERSGVSAVLHLNEPVSVVDNEGIFDG